MRTARFKKRLLEEKERLEKELESVGRKNPAVPGDWELAPSEDVAGGDIADQADVVVSREGNSAILNDLEARYDSVLAALERIEKGTYGRCSVCNAVIETARLEANPTATTCKKHL